MDELDKLLEQLSKSEEKAVQEVSSKLSDEEKFLILFLYEKSKEIDFNVNLKDYIKEALKGHREIKKEVIRDLKGLTPQINTVRDWAGFGEIDKKREGILLKQKDNEMNGLLDKTSQSLADQLMMMVAFNFAITKKSVKEIVKRTQIVKYGKVFSDPKRFTNGMIFEKARYGLYAVRPGMGPLVIRTSRRFCKSNAGKIRKMSTWRQMLPYFPLTGGSAIFNCRHILIPLKNSKKKQLGNPK